MVSALPNIKVYGGLFLLLSTFFYCMYISQPFSYPFVNVLADDRIPKLTEKVTHATTFFIGKNLKVTSLFTPCHTKGHVLYYVEQEGSDTAPALFCGDTLFVGVWVFCAKVLLVLLGSYFFRCLM